MSQNTSKRRICRRPIVPQRVRSIGKKGFAFIPNRFLQDGFIETLYADELLLYLFLVIVSDRLGMSFYHYDSICSILQMTLERYLSARNELIDKDLIAFDGTRFQVLSLPKLPIIKKAIPLKTTEDFEIQDGATIRHIIKQSMGIQE